MTNGLFQLHQFIADHFDLEELRTLCFNLGVRYDDLGGEGLSAKARELILGLGRRNQFDRLLEALRQDRSEAFDETGLSAGPAALETLYAALPAWDVPTVSSRSPEEALRDYLARAVAAYEARLYQLVARPSARPDRPYKFLYAFEIEDTGIFFGRDAASDALYQALLRDRLTVLHAPSGAGKTSLLNAGLSPRLIRDGRLPVYARAHDDPVRAIKQAIVPPSLGPWPELLHRLTLHEFLGLIFAHLSRQTQELVIILDQFEEFFVFWPERTRRQPCIDTLADCYANRTLPIRLLIALRKDYYSDLADFEGRIRTVFQNQYRLGALTRQEAKHAIIGPVQTLSRPITYEPALIARLLGDLAHSRPGLSENAGLTLPHLQIICTRLYEALAESETAITLATYERLGEAEGLLSGYLHDVLERLPGNQGSLARQVLKELIGSESTRRALDLKSLLARVAAHGAELADVLVRLVDARLISRDESAGEATYELAHDVLVEEVKTWLDSADLAVKQAEELLAREVTNWRAHGTLIPKDRLALLHAQRDKLRGLSDAAIQCIVQSALQVGFPVDDWTPVMRLQHVDLLSVVQPALSAPDYRVRASVVPLLPALGEVGLRALATLLSDPAPSVRVRAILALERLGNAAARQTLQSHLQHEVYIPTGNGEAGLYMDRYPVTNQAYELFLAHRPGREPPPQWRGRLAPERLRDHPVVGVSWEDAQAYAAWAGKRLPTAAEWRRAAGIQDGRRYPWGDAFSPGCCNTREAGLGTTTPVTEYSPQTDSPYGVADMTGNVWEWLDDAAGPDGQSRLLCGGAWYYSADFARIDYDRFWRQADHRGDVVGFRLCFSALV